MSRGTPRMDATDYRRALAKTMSEAEWQAEVIREARVQGWRCAHFRKVRQINGVWLTPVSADGRGFPDLVLAREEDRVIFVECKRQRGSLEPDQKAWRDVLVAAGAEWYSWRPGDRDEMSEVLARRGRP